jgi:hypothetical protein
MESTEPNSDEAMRADLWTVVSGHFTPDSVGPDRYEELLSRVRARAAEYLDLAESLFLGDAFDAALHSELHVPRLLAVVRDTEPERARVMAEQLITRIDAATADTAALTDAGPEEADRIAQLLHQRQAQLADVMR